MRSYVRVAIGLSARQLARRHFARASVRAAVRQSARAFVMLALDRHAVLLSFNEVQLAIGP